MKDTTRAGQTEASHARLARRLRELRKRGGYGGVEAGRRAKMSQSKVSRIENARTLPTIEDVEALLAAYNASPGEHKELVDLALGVREASKRSRVVVPRGISRLQRKLHLLEERTAVVRSYSPAMVLGLAQTAAYARTVFAAALTGEDLEAAIVGRQARKAALDHPERSFVLLMSEGALRWQAAAATVMVEQLDLIAELSRRSNVQVGIIPWTRAAAVFCTHSFDIYDTTAVLVGTEISSVTFTDEADVAVYHRLFEDLSALAAWGEDARRELARIASEYRMLA